MKIVSLDPAGNVRHDCRTAGCGTSLDGKRIDRSKLPKGDVPSSMVLRVKATEERT